MEGKEYCLGICWVLKEDQYLDSEVWDCVLGLVLSLGLTGKFFETLASSIEAAKPYSLPGFLGFKNEARLDNDSSIKSRGL